MKARKKKKTRQCYEVAVHLHQIVKVWALDEEQAREMAYHEGECAAYRFPMSPMYGAEVETDVPELVEDS